MESLGEKLRMTRESKGISFNQAGLDTKLSIRYLEALESENFSKFPGEAYITGFIKNYGAYLDLDPNELLGMYRAIKIQEQPIPVDQLLKRPSALPKIAIGVGVALVVFGLVALVFLLVTSRAYGAEAPAPALPPPPPRLSVEHIMGEDSFEHRFFMGDSLLVSADPEFADAGGMYRLELLDVIGEDAVIQTPGGPVLVGPNDYASIDLNNNGAFDLRVIAIDYAWSIADTSVLLRFERYAAERPVSPEMQVAIVPAAVAPRVMRQPEPTVIFSSVNPHPFTLQADFLGGNMFRWEVLLEPARRGRNERFFQRLDDLTVPNMHNGIRIWTSNAQAARFQVIGGGRSVPVELGSPGEVVVADIRWVRGDDNVFRLVVARLEV